MIGDWQLWSNAIPKDICEEIKNTCLKGDYIQCPVKHGDASFYDKEIYQKIDLNFKRVKHIKVFKEQSPEIFSHISYYIHQANRKYFGFNISYIDEVYLSNFSGDQLGYSDWHNDVFLASKFPFDRKLTFLMQLSDPDSYDGGEFEFRDCDKLDNDFFSPQGSILVFPSLYYYKINEVTRGNKFILEAYGEGPKWG